MPSERDKQNDTDISNEFVAFSGYRIFLTPAIDNPRNMKVKMKLVKNFLARTMGLMKRYNA